MLKTEAEQVALLLGAEWCCSCGQLTGEWRSKGTGKCEPPVSTSEEGEQAVEEEETGFAWL